MGLFLLGLGPRAFMGLGILVPYISPPLIHTRLPGRIKEPAEPFGPGSPMAWDSCGYGFSLMLISKDALLSLLPDGLRTKAARMSVIFGIRRVIRESCPFIA